jgi:hypothetical protein
VDVVQEEVHPAVLIVIDGRADLGLHRQRDLTQMVEHVRSGILRGKCARSARALVLRDQEMRDGELLIPHALDVGHDDVVEPVAVHIHRHDGAERGGRHGELGRDLREASLRRAPAKARGRFAWPVGGALLDAGEPRAPSRGAIVVREAVFAHGSVSGAEHADRGKEPRGLNFHPARERRALRRLRRITEDDGARAALDAGVPCKGDPLGQELGRVRVRQIVEVLVVDVRVANEVIASIARPGDPPCADGATLRERPAGGIGTVIEDRAILGEGAQAVRAHFLVPSRRGVREDLGEGVRERPVLDEACARADLHEPLAV